MKTVRSVVVVGVVVCCLGIGVSQTPGVRAKRIWYPALCSQIQNPAPQPLSPGAKKTYPVPLKIGDYLKAVVEQQGIDVGVRLRGPDGSLVTEVDDSSPNEGPETLTWVAEKDGTYQLEIESAEGETSSGTYVLTLDPPRPATETERAQVKIDQLSDEVVSLFQQRKYDQAVQLAQEALDLAEKVLGPNHSYTGDCINNLAALYWGRGNYDKAEPLFVRALAIAEKTFGPVHPDTVVSMNNLAQLYRAKGDFAKAEPLYLQSLALREKLFGTDSKEVADSFNSLGQLYQELSRYPEAETYLQRALALREKKFGPDHPFVGHSLNNLALLYLQTGKYARAEPLFLRALAIQEKAFGPDHPNIAGSLNDLAGLYQTRGNYAKAELLFQRSVAVWEKAMGPYHPEVALSLNNLADLYWTKGDYARAEALFVRSLAIREKTLGPHHPDVAVSLNNLASVYQSQNDDARAQPLFERSLAIREKVFGPDHPSVARGLSNLGLLYRNNGDLEKAEIFFRRSLAIREKTLGPDHPEVANMYGFLAGLYRYRGDYQQAEAFFLRDLAISEKALGGDHPEVARTLNNLAKLYRVKGDISQAIAYQVRANNVTERDLLRNLVTGSENQKMLYLETTAYQTNQTISLHLQSAPQDQTALQAAITVILRRKGRLLDAASQGIEVVRQRANREDQKLLDELTEAKSELSRLTLRGPGKEGIERHRAFLKELDTKADQLEAQVNARSAEYRSLVQPITLEAVQQAIPADAALIEFALYQPFDLKTRTYGNWRYVAYVVQGSGQKEQGAGVRGIGAKLSEINPIWTRGHGDKGTGRHNQIVVVPRSQPEVIHAHPVGGSLSLSPCPRVPVSQKRSKFLILALMGVRDQGSESITNQTNQQKSNQQQPNLKRTDQRSKTKSPEPRTLNPEPYSWVDLGEAGPIDQVITAFRTVLSDSKKDIPREVLPVAQVLDTLVMKPVRKLIGTKRHLLISPDGMLNLMPFSALVTEQGTYLIENYTLTYLTSGRDLLRLKVKVPGAEPAVVIANPEYATGSGPVLAGQTLKPLLPLPGTEREGREIQKILGVQTQLFVQTKATKDVVTRIHRPEVLHIATHGYFPADALREVSDEENRQSGESEAEAIVKPTIENPLLRSWLFFASANRGSENSNGVLTALEASQLDLWGTKLVVLSACDTGLGEVKNGDGVYGLRRALVLAGSEAQMMSLWAVSDTGTRDLMTEYYRRLKAGEGRSAALRNTQLKLLKDPRRQHPFYWASFIQSGEWKPLERKNLNSQ